MNSYTPTTLNFQNRKKKGLVKMFEGISAPFYWTSEVVAEGTPMRPLTTEFKMATCVAGSSHGAKCFGLALQETYDEAALGQLKGYHFANDTRQRLNGLPIGLLTGKGWAGTLNYSGSVAYGEQASVGASGKLVVSGVANDKLPIIFEGAGTDGATLVRIRFDFPLDVIPAAS